MAFNAIQEAQNLYNKIKGFVEPTVNQIANTAQSFVPTLSNFKNQVIRTALNTQKAISNQPLFQAPGIGFTPNIPSPTVGQGANFLDQVLPSVKSTFHQIDPTTQDPNAWINNNKGLLGDVRRFSFNNLWTPEQKQGQALQSKAFSGGKLTLQEKDLLKKYQDEQMFNMAIGAVDAGAGVGKGLLRKFSPTTEQVGQAESQIFRDAQAAMKASQSTSPYQQAFSKMRNFLRLAGEKKSKETGELFREHIPQSVFGQSSDELASSMGVSENELMSKLTEGLNIGGTGLRKSRGFTNVRSIDNPLTLGKDWRIRKNVDESKKFVSEMMEEKRILKDPRNITDSFDDLVNKTPVDVRKKVNIIDYLRTPNRVLEKIGLGEEAKLLRTKYDDYLADLPKEIDKITTWSKRVTPSSNKRIFQWLDGDKIKLNNEELKVANEVKDYLGQWADKLRLPQDKRVSSYITHLFEKGKITKEFDPDLAKIIQGKVVGSVYDPFLQRRVGAPEYLQDTWKALDAYVKRATRKFHMDQALEKVAVKAEGLPLESYNYVKGRIARINMQPTDIDNLIDNAIKSSPVGYRLGQRPVTATTQRARQMVFRGLLGLNPGTALRNLQQTTNSYAVLGEKNFGIGLMKTVQNLPKLILGKDTELKAAGVLGKDIVQDRTISAVGKFWQYADDTLFYMFNMAEKINRGIAYWGAKSKALSQGMNEAKAIEYAKDIVGKTQFYYDVIDTPAALQSDLAKTLFQFAKYPLAQTEFLVEMIKNKNVAGSLRWIASNLLFVFTAGKLLGLEPQDMFPQFRFGVPPTLQLPFETSKAALNVPDQYGNVSDEQNPLMRVLQSKDVLRGALNYVPAGGQIRKSTEAIKAMQEGASYTPSGRFRFEVKPSLGTALFGIWNTKEGKEYLNKRLGVNLSEEEKQGKDINKQQTQIQVATEKVAQGVVSKLKNTSKEERLKLLSEFEEKGLLTEDVRKKIVSLQKKNKLEGQTPFVKAVDLITTNQGKANFIVSYFKRKATTSSERAELLNQLDSVGLLTVDLREKIAQLAKQ